MGGRVSGARRGIGKYPAGGHRVGNGGVRHTAGLERSRVHARPCSHPRRRSSHLVLIKPQRPLRALRPRGWARARRVGEGGGNLPPLTALPLPSARRADRHPLCPCLPLSSPSRRCCCSPAASASPPQKQRWGRPLLPPRRLAPPNPRACADIVMTTPTLFEPVLAACCTTYSHRVSFPSTSGCSMSYREVVTAVWLISAGARLRGRGFGAAGAQGHGAVWARQIGEGGGARACARVPGFPAALLRAAAGVRERSKH